MNYRSLPAAFVAGFLMILLSFGAGAAGDAGPTVISDEPWLPDEGSLASKVVYGSDDRVDVYEIEDPTDLRWAASTCGLLNSSDLTLDTDGTYSLDVRSYRIGGRPACPEEPFGSQPVVMFCTGFLVGEDLIATAGHCYDTGNISSTRFVFGFVMEDATTPVIQVPVEQVYAGVEIVGRQLRGELDYCVIRIDRPVTVPNAIPFVLRRTGLISVGEPVGVIGHPAGLPLKLSFGTETSVRDSSNTGYFSANLDTYGGNSGSPVINADTGILEGILVRGEQDYVLTSTCFRSNVLSDSAGAEEVSRSTTFTEFVPDADEDELPDDWEIRYSLDMNSALDDDGHDGDADLDTVTNYEECIRGTHPGRSDSDFDGVSDADEIAADTDPRGTNETHSADSNRDFHLSLSEALRVVQLFHAGAYHCDLSSEDGFAPGGGDQGCNFHHSDFGPQDRTVDLPELERTLDLYAAGGYARDVSTVDSFTPRP